MTDEKEDKQLNSQQASLVVDWRTLEQDVGALGAKLTELHGQADSIDEKTIRDLEKRYENISQQLMIVKEKTYDQFLDSTMDNEVPSSEAPGGTNALESAKQQAAQLGQKISQTANSANTAIGSRVAGLNATIQPHRQAASDAISNMTARIGTSARDAGTELMSKWNALKSEIENTYQKRNPPTGSEVARVKRDPAKADPESEFQSPQEIVDHALLTRAEKITALRSWAFQVRHRLDSASEGMAPEKQGVISSDAELLRRIEIHLDTLTTSDS